MIKSWVNNPQSHDMILITDANPLRWDPSHNQILPSNPTKLCARWTHWPLVAMANADNIRIETTSHSECTFLNVGRTSHPKRIFSVLPQPLLIKRKAVSRQRLLCNAK